MGILRVKFRTDGNIFHGIFGVSGDQGNQWNTAMVAIPSGNEVKVFVDFFSIMWNYKTILHNTGAHSCLRLFQISRSRLTFFFLLLKWHIQYVSYCRSFFQHITVKI